MELKDYLKIIKTEKKTIIIVTLLTALFALVFSIVAPRRYEVSVSLFINRSGTQQTDQFKYDGYYSLEAEELIADNLEKTLQSPEVVNTIYEEAGIDSNLKNIGAYKKKFAAHKMSNQYVEVGFISPRQSDAEKIAKALTDVANQKISTESTTSGQEISFLITSNQPVILEKKPDSILNTLAGILSGLFLGIFAVLLKKYFS